MVDDTTIAGAYRNVDALSGTVASLRCRCAELEAETEALKAERSELYQFADALKAERDQARNDLATARVAESRRGW